MCEQWVLESIAQGVHNCAKRLGAFINFLAFLCPPVFFAACAIIVMGIRSWYWREK